MPRSYSLPSRIPIVVSAAVTASGNTGNLRTASSSVGNPIPLCDAVTLILDVTAYTGTAGPNVVNIYIDSSPDGGTTWYPSWAFGNVTTSTDIQRAELRTIGLGPNEAATLTRVGTTINTTSAVTVNTVLSPDHRVRTVFAAGATGQSITFAVWAICTDSGTYGH